MRKKKQIAYHKSCQQNIKWYDIIKDTHLGEITEEQP